MTADYTTMAVEDLGWVGLAAVMGGKWRQRGEAPLAAGGGGGRQRCRGQRRKPQERQADGGGEGATVGRDNRGGKMTRLEAEKMTVEGVT